MVIVAAEHDAEILFLRRAPTTTGLNAYKALDALPITLGYPYALFTTASDKPLTVRVGAKTPNVRFRRCPSVKNLIAEKTPVVAAPVKIEKTKQC